MKPKIIAVILLCVSCYKLASAQTNEKGYFNVASPQLKGAKDYGTITVSADKQTVIIGTVMAYGENVKGLTVRINNGFAFKLAPAQTGTILNYVGSSLDIVLQPGDKARFEFIDANKNTGAKLLNVSGQIIQ